MPNLSTLLLSTFMLILTGTTNASPLTTIPLTNSAPLIDGNCGESEWQSATRLQLPAQISVYFMHDESSLFVCAKGKAHDYTVIDLYIEDTQTGHLYNLHASAQLTERQLTDKDWGDSVFWNQQDWTGFWVPYAGEEETENGKRTQFLKGSHREIQVLRKKFVGNTWNMMVRISAVNHQGKYGAEFIYPQHAADNDTTTWANFSFSS